MPALVLGFVIALAPTSLGATGVRATSLEVATSGVASSSVKSGSAATTIQQGATQQASPQQASTGERVRGVVTGPQGEAVTGARVEVLPNGAVTSTDEEGVFELEASGNAVILVAHARFAPQTIQLTGSLAEPLDVQLELAQLVEVVEVWADEIGDTDTPRAIAMTAVSGDDLPRPPRAISELAAHAPSVAESGQGGLFQVVSVRGVSRHRVLSLIDGVRITTDRRAGVASSFVDPELVGELTVLRGPASTYYGSGALGGALHLFPRRYSRLELAAGWESVGDERFASGGWGSEALSLGLAHRASDDGETADGASRFDRFRQTSASLRWDQSRDVHSWRVSILPSFGSDIGKPNTDLPERETLYPRERHLIARASWSHSDRWDARVFMHPNELTTQVIDRNGARQTSRTEVDNESFDLGGGLVRSLGFGSLQGRLGFDLFSRRGVDAVETTRSPDGEVLESLRSLVDGESDEAALFGVFEREIGTRVHLEAGVRATWAHRQVSRDRAAQQLLGEPGSRERWLGSGFVALTAELGRGFSLVSTVGTGTRVPDLSELFFTGTTGRGGQIGNPELDPERSLSADLGLRWVGTHARIEVTTFRSEISHFIERVELANDVRTFTNLGEGRIRGFEVDGLWWVHRDLQFDFGLQSLDGRSDEGVPLADVAPDEVRAGVRWTFGAWQWSSRARYREALSASEIGDGEVPRSDAWLLETAIGRDLGKRLRVELFVDNLLDEEWTPSADRKAVPARGRSVGLVVRLRR